MQERQVVFGKSGMRHWQKKICAQITWTVRCRSKPDAMRGQTVKIGIITSNNLRDNRIRQSSSSTWPGSMGE